MAPGRAWLLPREHGAYMQLGFPLAAAWVLGTPGPSSFALGAGAVLAFLSHESLLVVLGRRGARRKEVDGRRALGALALLLAPAAALGALGLALAAPGARAYAAVPAALALAVPLLVARGLGRSLLGELWVSATLSAVVLPAGVFAGLAPSLAAQVWVAWAVGLGVATAAAHGLVFRGKDGGRTLRVAALAGALVCAAALVLALASPVPALLAISPLPLSLASLVLALAPPSPKRMMTIGFLLTGACAFSLGLQTAAVLGR